MRRLIIAVLATALTVTGLVASTQAAEPTTPKPAVYLIPHQDDETLTYSREVIEQWAAGNPTYFYLMTDGSHTGVCRTKIPLDAAACTELRDEEFEHASHFLGVPDENIIKVPDPATGVRPNDLPGQEVANRQVQWVLDDIEQRTGWREAAMWKTMSWEDDHPGHAVYGKALHDLRLTGEVTDSRFFLKRGHDGTWPNKPACTGVIYFANIKTVNKWPEYWRMWAALHSYGIGQISVPSNFADMRENLDARYHTEKKYC